jgi:hypothetical protein
MGTKTNASGEKIARAELFTDVNAAIAAAESVT